MKHLYLSLGIFFVILGAIGVILPVMPTVPFAILAAFCFSKSSPRMHQWVLNLPKIGPMVRDWDENKVISTKAKILCTIGVTLFLGSSVYFSPYLYLKFVLVLIGLSVLIFVLTRPSFKRA